MHPVGCKQKLKYLERNLKKLPAKLRTCTGTWGEDRCWLRFDMYKATKIALTLCICRAAAECVHSTVPHCIIQATKC